MSTNLFCRSASLLAALLFVVTTNAALAAGSGGGGRGGGGSHSGGGGGSFHSSGGGGGGGHYSGAAGAHVNAYSGRSTWTGPGGSAPHASSNYSGQNYALNHTVNPGWNNHSGNWSSQANSLHHNQSWAGGVHHDWDHHFYSNYPGGWYGGWGWNDYPFYFGFSPWFSLGWGGYGYCAPYAYGDAGANYYAYAPEQVSYAAQPLVRSANMVAEDPGLESPEAAPVGGAAGGSEALQYYNEARSSFTRADYRSALRFAGHAAVESPQNPKVHETISLALFALGDYRSAATEAHAAMALGQISDWNTLYAYYGDVERYTKQLRALERAVHDTPGVAADHFLLGYHYLMTGAKPQAQQQFAQAAKLTPDDKLAQHYLKQLESGAALSPPPLPVATEKPQGHSL